MRPSNAYAKRFGRRLITQMQCSTLRYCYNEKTNTQRRPITGGAILPSDSRSEWAARARRSLKFCEMQGYLIASA